MLVLSYLSVMRINGADAADFLHNQVSADVKALAPGESTFACYCEPKGRVLALMLIGRQQDDYYVILSRSLLSAIARRLQIYVMRSKVNIETLEAHAISGVRGFDNVSTPGDNIAVVSVPDSDDAIVILSEDAPAEEHPAQQDAWKLAELKRGISWLCAETSGQFLPQMLGYDQIGAVNFRKGCYPGQEIVARIHYLGKIKRHPRLICTPAVICPNPLDEIQIFSNDKSFDAVITDCGHREDGGGCLFVVTRMEPDSELEQVEYQGQIVPLA